MRIENLGTYLMIISLAALLFLALASPMHAQTASGPQPPPAASSPKVEVTSEVFQLAGGGTATAQTVRAQITKEYFSGYYRLWSVPQAKDQAQFHIVGVRYTRSIADLISQSKLAFDGSQIPVFVEAGFGSKRDGLGNDPKPAFEIGGGVGFPLGNVAGGKLGGEFRAGYVKQIGANGRGFGFQSSPAIGGGLRLGF